MRHGLAEEIVEDSRSSASDETCDTVPTVQAPRKPAAQPIAHARLQTQYKVNNARKHYYYCLDTPRAYSPLARNTGTRDLKTLII